MTRSGGQLLADQLALHDVELAFCVPGESYLALLDGLYAHRDRLRVITCRHEAAAANAADAYGKLTGRPGVCMVTRGPGRDARRRPACTRRCRTPRRSCCWSARCRASIAAARRFQEIDYEQMFGRIAKWVFEIDRPERIPELVARAFATAVGGPARAGRARAARGHARGDDGRARRGARAARGRRAAPAADLARMRELLAAAERPLAIVGGGGWTPQGADDIGAFLTASGIPAAASFRCQDVVDNRLPVYCGDLGLGVNPALARRVREADLVLAIGTRLSETETGGYTLPDAARCRARRSCTCTRTPPSSGASTARSSASSRGCPSSPPRRARSSRSTAAATPTGARPRAPTTRRSLRYDPAPGQRRRHGGRARAPARAAARRDRHQRRGQLHGLGAPLLAVLALPLAARAALGRDGLRRSGGGRRQARPPRAARRRVRGRRLLPDVRAGARDDGRQRSRRCS